MRLAALVEAVEGSELRGSPDVEVRSVHHDSTQVQPGALFCCIRGARVDGHDFARDAVEAGAVALLCERPLDIGVPQVLVPDARAALGPVASLLYAHPSRSLKVVGVTGTNGKTTTVHLLESPLSHAGVRARSIGTLTGARTTPEAPELQARLAAFRDEGIEVVAMEVSSHALALGRVDGTTFEVGIFTNLSPEHLDFHRTMNEYFDAKKRLFEPGRTATALVNADDPWGQRLAAEVRVPCVTYSVTSLKELQVGVAGSRYRWRDLDVSLPLGGRFNIPNALAASEAALLLGISPAEIAAGLEAAEGVPGRFELVDEGQEFVVVVDYAHTPDGLEQLLRSAREVCEGSLAVVFGCGGERDHQKRPQMGEVASRLADRVLITSDNPRGEDPVRIIEQVIAGVGDQTKVTIEADRRRAIEMACRAAQPGDVVVIAGKGHETTQITRSKEVAFDDREVAREVLRDLR